MADFTSPAQAFQQGTTAAQTSQDNWLKNQAMAALVKQYGPTAGAPAETAQVQTNALNSQIDPLKVLSAQQQSAAQTANIQQFGPGAGDPTATETDVDTAQKQGDAQRMAAYRAAQMLKSAANPDGSIPPDAYQKLIVPNAQLLGIDPAHVEALGTTLSQPGGVQHLDSISQALLGPTKVTGAPVVAQDANGNSVLVNKDQYGRPIMNTLPAGVTATANTRANTAAFSAQTRAQQGFQRLGIAQQNADTSTFRAGVTANNSMYGAPDGVNLPQQRASVAIPPNGIPVPVQAPNGSTIPFDESSASHFIQGAFPGAVMTSGERSTAKNASLPGAAVNSEHLYGQAADILLPKGVSFADFKGTLQEAGLPTTELLNVTPANAAPGEGAHVHWAWGDAAKQLTRDPAAAAAAAPPTGTLFDSLPPKGRIAAIGQAQQLANQSSNLANTNRIIDTVAKQISPYTAGTGSMLKDLPGTAQKDLQANLVTLKAQGLTAWIQSLKNSSGQTGISRILQSEANAAMQIYGNMEQDQSAKQLAFHLALFKQAVNNLAAHAHQAFKAQYGVTPEGALGIKPVGAPSPAPTQYNAVQQAALKKYGL